ncbi:MAG: hemerythrin family protein [Rhodospirillaceae bacterium]
MAIVWRAGMSIDGGPIDDDHKFLITQINELERTLDEGFSVAAILATLKKLQYYCVYHFVREEAIQKEIGFHDRVAHAEKHRQLVTMVDEAVALFERGVFEEKQERIKDNLLRLLGAWIIGHVLKHDMPMKESIRIYRRAAAYR